ncbi:DUF4244 domain-containing protein [Kineosporia sp. J2-2]|uniref:DUF4244 domain-containing protein n=1 Tax=Kineosporia corallincola TaxID=2835133 RepID=A0ABS5T956_9ACTN|nr:DUF4244 domain-containing protein [Kineosporia corallincola]MBT0767363.1 DUF4244 domain-containing protein [Kineosporia corallincola]
MRWTRSAAVSLRRVTSAPRGMGEIGASTAEYAMTMLAACTFAGVLMAIVRGSAVKGLLLTIIQKALNLG